MSEKLLFKIRGLQKLSVESEQKLLNTIRPMQVKKGKLLLTEGQVCKNIFYLESGFLISTSNDDGRTVSLNFTLADNFTTNLKSLRNQLPSDYSIKACEDSLVWVFNRESLMDLYASSADFNSFSRKLLEYLVTEQEEHINLIKLKTPKERYNHMLKNQPELLQKTTLTLLSSYLGISRETLSRIRKTV